MDPEPEKKCEKHGDNILLSEIIVYFIYGKQSNIENLKN